MSILQIVSTKMVLPFARLFVSILVLPIALSIPVLSHADTDALEDLAQGLDDFTPKQSEKSLDLLESNDTVALSDASKALETTPISSSSRAVIETPSGWKQHSFGGLIVSVPPKWAVIKKDYDNLMVGILDKATKKGVMLVVMAQRRNPLDEKTPPKMKITTLKDKKLGSHIFAHKIYQMDSGDIKIYTHMFFSKKPYMKTKYSEKNFVMVGLSLTNLDLTDYKEIFSTIIDSIKPAEKIRQKPTGPQQANNGFVTFTLHNDWKVLSNNSEFLSFAPKDTGAAYMTIGIGEYAHQDINAKDDFATPPHISRTSILGQSATLYEGETTESELFSDGVMHKGIKRLFVLDKCTADDTPITLVQVATPDWLKSTGFDALEQSIVMTLPKGAKECASNLKTTQDKISKDESADKYNRSLLHKAVLKGDLKEVKHLLDSGENVNIKDKLDRTPLHYVAIISGHVGMAKLLLESGADIDAIDKAKEWTPLFYASFMNHQKMVDLLIKMGADQTIRDKYNRTASDYKRNKR
ncbi:ankyrin repeat protein, putative [hydrothermal vent metagenome]|uniref:Ankyrin repeat protein, putative n=1 Tax=hydrothermal vent metagenome TaxID=652676 RepID=A0A1W1BDB9_9ZZZZ